MSLRGIFVLDDQHPFTGWHMLAVVLTFFGVIIAVNVALSVAAGGTFPGLVVRNSYVASQNYDQLLQDARAQDATGISLTLAHEGGFLAARFLDGRGAPMPGLDVVALALRPSSSADDEMHYLAADGEAYRSAKPLPPGQWAVEIEARRGGQLVYREVKRVIVSGGAG